MAEILPFLIPILALTIPIVAILSKTFTDIQKTRAEASAELGKATGHLADELAEAKAERDRLRQRLETVEAIVTSEGFDLEREARRAGITQSAEEIAAKRIDEALLDLPEAEDTRPGADRRRVR